MHARAAVVFTWAVVVLVLGVLLAEGIARFVLGLGTPPLSMRHPTIEYMFKRNQDVLRFGNRVRINQHGMRSDPLHEKAPGELRILVFGDSVVNGGSLTDQGVLATTILQRNLAQDLKRPVVVGNVSAGSWGPGNWLAYAREFGFFSSDVVVLVISSHDAADVPTFEPLDPTTHPTEPPLLALQEVFQRYLPQWLAARGWLDRPTASTATSDALDPGLEARAVEDLKAFLALALGSVPRVIVLQYPERDEVAGGRFGPGHYAIREACKSAGVDPIPLGPAFQPSLQAGDDPYRDEIHPNDTGQRILATAIESTLTSDARAADKEARLTSHGYAPHP